MDKLLTRKELAERWQVTPKAIDDWRKRGILTPCQGIPTIRFSIQHIVELEGIKLEKFSPLERRILLQELDEVKKERDYLQSVINEMNFVMAKVMYRKVVEKKIE